MGYNGNEGISLSKLSNNLSAYAHIKLSNVYIIPYSFDIHGIYKVSPYFALNLALYHLY